MKEDALNVEKKVILPINAQVPQVVEKVVEEEEEEVEAEVLQAHQITEEEAKISIKHMALNLDPHHEYNNIRKSYLL